MDFTMNSLFRIYNR